MNGQFGVVEIDAGATVVLNGAADEAADFGGRQGIPLVGTTRAHGEAGEAAKVTDVEGAWLEAEIDEDGQTDEFEEALLEFLKRG